MEMKFQNILYIYYLPLHQQQILKNEISLK